MKMTNKRGPEVKITPKMADTRDVILLEKLGVALWYIVRPATW
jgi:hypothetical protein